MPFDKFLAARVEDALIPAPAIIKKKMFGGVCFMQDGLAFAGVWGDGLIVRVGPDDYHATLCEPHVREFDITGKPMRGWVVVDPDGVDSDLELRHWLRRAMDFASQLPRVATSPRKRRPKGS